MAQQHLGQAELDAWYSSINQAAGAWQKQKTFIEGSKMAQDFADPSIFQAEADANFSLRGRPITQQISDQMEMTRAQGHLSGLRGGVTDRRLGELAGTQTSMIAGIRGEEDLMATERETLNERNMFSALQQLAELEMGVTSTQQQLAQRLGTQAQWDKQYKSPYFYKPERSGEAAVEFFDYMGLR